jgi:uncharacterized protein YcbK (DUF882 family)
MCRVMQLRRKLRSSAVLPGYFATSICRFVSARQVCTLAAFVVAVAAGPAASAQANPPHKHAHPHAMKHLLANVVLPDVGFIPDDEVPVVPEDGRQYELKLTRRSGEIIDVIYRVGDVYIPEALDHLSQFLRDSHNDEVKDYDPRTFDLLHTILARLNRSSSEIEVLCGYRTVETNEDLRASGTTNAAEHSQHIEANAIDIRVPGIPAAQLRAAALSLHAGGVGYYPRGQFVHVDTGPVRKWTFTRRRARHPHRRRPGATSSPHPSIRPTH